ncbi:hypothetical protein T265_03473 [Opisthorchis viverrini]|uniref:Uncharacterized protein n=1 Tax=Opisthorchis viverrini TaxID=6198 RepID=A0A075A335_OPIVI|nr:hypothetical protein T265_03473 [Opisthorchis viverrini]KER29990.1 hypothetical protein T265_03473 [Opisthorchis viverrini]
MVYVIHRILQKVHHEVPRKWKGNFGCSSGTRSCPWYPEKNQASEARRLQVFDSRCLRTIARVGWCRRIRNEVVGKGVFGCVTGTSIEECVKHQKLLPGPINRKSTSYVHSALTFLNIAEAMLASTAFGCADE